MKKAILILGVLLLCLLARSQERKFWFDVQMVKHIGLNKWNGNSGVNNELYRPSTGYLRGSMHKIIYKNWGLFFDTYIGYFSYPESRYVMEDYLMLDMNRYYLKDSDESHSSKKAVGLGATVGGFFRIKVGDNGKWGILPYLGIGVIDDISNNTPYKRYAFKERDTNNMYDVFYSWIGEGRYSSRTLGYLTSRINFTYKIARHTNIAFGIEYEFYLDRADFTAELYDFYRDETVSKHTIKGNYLNKLGFSIGLSFR